MVCKTKENNSLISMFYIDMIQLTNTYILNHNNQTYGHISRGVTMF